MKYKEQRAPSSGGLLPLPQDTIKAFAKAEQRRDALWNIGLYFERYIRFADDNWQMDYQLPRPNNPGRRDKFSAKLWNLQKIANAQDALNQQWNKGVFQDVVNRWQKIAESQNAVSFKRTPAWRFVIGLGDKTALEVGFTFHRIYGFPVIPGSALKGLARAVAFHEIADSLGAPKLSLSEVKKRAEAKSETPLKKLDEMLLANDERIKNPEAQKKAAIDEQKALQTLQDDPAVKQINLSPENKAKINQFRRIFGTQHAAGEAIFFDGVPAAAPQLELDVMNVHYPDYYGKDKFPSDNQNPNPIPFLTVGRTPFWFAVGWRKQNDKTGLTQAIHWLKSGLNEFGLGAKTAAGYGYFGEVT